MNLRDIKKDIEYVLSAFVDDCYFLATCNPSIPDDKLSGLLDEAIELFNDLKDKVNVKSESGKSGNDRRYGRPDQPSWDSTRPSSAIRPLP